MVASAPYYDDVRAERNQNEEALDYLHDTEYQLLSARPQF